MSITQDEIKFLADNDITHAHENHGVRVGVKTFMFTNALVTNYDYFTAHQHRFCYPNHLFLTDVMERFAQEWDGKSMPPDGWVKYKGSLGEFGPEDKQQLQELMA